VEFQFSVDKVKGQGHGT